MNRSISLRSVSAMLMSAAVAGSAMGDVTLTSSDGRWVATIANSGGAAGQCTGMKDMTQSPAMQSFLVNTRHYVRFGSIINFGSAVSERMEDHYSLVNFSSTADTFNATLQCNDDATLICVVHGEMVAGNTGGLKVGMSWADSSPATGLFIANRLKPFVYANLNVDGMMLSNTGGWSGDHFFQSAQSGTGNVRWFRGLNPSAHEGNQHSLMQDALDNGVTDLGNFMIVGPTDINTALTWTTFTSNDTATDTIVYAIGNPNISVAGDMGVPSEDTVFYAIESSDARWRARVTSGALQPEGMAGRVQDLFDMTLPAAQRDCLLEQTYYLGIGPRTGPESVPFKLNWHDLAINVRTGVNGVAHTVLTSDDFPGMLAIIETRMIAGASGGMATSFKVVDLLERDLHVSPFMYVDLDVDATTQNNTGGFEGNHFWQLPSALSPVQSERWIKAMSFDTYESGFWMDMFQMLDAGVSELGNVADAGPVDLACAFGFQHVQLQDQQPYVMGVAVGAPGVNVPGSFVQPTFPAVTCTGDLNNSATVDGVDLGMLIHGWGSPTAPGDLNGDGAINGLDLGILLNNWGFCP